MSNSECDDAGQPYEEQIAFLERENDHQRQQLADLWNEVAELKRVVTKLSRRIDALLDGGDQ